MNPSTSSIDELPKPITSPRRPLPEAPPSYYDFPPSYTANSETVTDELPAYVPREFPVRQCAAPPPSQQRIFTVLPRQAYAIRMQRRARGPPPDSYTRRRLNLLVGTFFILLLGTVIIVLTILMTVCLLSHLLKMHNSREDLDRFYEKNPEYHKSRSSTITIPAHGIIPAVYSIETGDYYNRSSEFPEEPSGLQKSMKIAFVLLVLTLLLIGFIFAIVSVTRLTKA